MDEKHRKKTVPEPISFDSTSYMSAVYISSHKTDGFFSNPTTHTKKTSEISIYHLNHIPLSNAYRIKLTWFTAVASTYHKNATKIKIKP